MNKSTLDAEKQHLADLLEAIQRCVYFLDASSRKLKWPLASGWLETEKKSVELFEILAAVNERFAKLQDTLAAAMRHACLLSGEPADRFLKVLSFYEKVGVIESIETWQLCRTVRNLAAHDYEIDYAEITEHFNALRSFTPELYKVAGRFLEYCRESLKIEPKLNDFSAEFDSIFNM
ncbi:hypothetical protein [Methylomonas methanica]|jgi:hypothetical protein|uniref:DUF86 domain-containing protein n=1 Tax=Methylomonas methanica TaxID=421 RepID=A0A177MQF1_METMH|nr:hypothetical protein [Methylomonas methanica]OAI07089.1 hypothetical protein A1332_09440 [Methylomonas methanica]